MVCGDNSSPHFLHCRSHVTLIIGSVYKVLELLVLLPRAVVNL